MRLGIVLALALSVLTLAQPIAPFMATPAKAQEDAELPPLPRPRPDPDNLPPRIETPSSTEATEAINSATSTPQPVTLTATVTADGAPIEEGVTWRIFDAEPDASGQLAMAAKSDQGVAELSLPPGNYMVHLAYGSAQISETLAVNVGQNTRSFSLEAGALRLNAAVTGDIAIAPNLLTFDLFTASEETSRNLIAEGLTANQIVTMNAGTYHVVSHFGTINAVVRADLRVEAGQLTDATLYHHAAQVSLKLVSEAGGEAIADVAWTIKTGDGSTVFSEVGAFPTTVLAAGDYLVLAKQGEQVFNREFSVQTGAPAEVEVLTAVY